MTFSSSNKKGIAFYAFRKVVNYQLINELFKTECSIRKWYMDEIKRGRARIENSTFVNTTWMMLLTLSQQRIRLPCINKTMMNKPKGP